MYFYYFFREKDIHPMKMKNTDIGLVFSYNQDINGRGPPKKGLMVIGPSKNVGLIRTQHAPLCFTQIDNSFYYGYWSETKQCYQISCIDSTGVETFIAGERLTRIDLGKTHEWVRETGKT